MRRLYLYAIIALTLIHPLPVSVAQDAADPTGPVLSILQELQADPAKSDEVAAQLRARIEKLKTDAEASRKAVEETKGAIASNTESQSELAAKVGELEQALAKAKSSLEESKAAGAEAQTALKKLETALPEIDRQIEVHETTLRLIEAAREEQAPPAEQAAEPKAEAAPKPDVPVQLTAASTSAQDELFTKRVLPVLADNCFGCHGPDKQKSGMRLDSHAGMLAGGERGPAIVPGDPENSRLIKAIRHDGELKMPPTGKLGSVATSLLTEWVRAGAVFPGEAAAPVEPAPKDEPPVEPEPVTVPKADDKTFVAKTDAAPAVAAESNEGGGFQAALAKLKAEAEALAEHAVSEATERRIEAAKGAAELSSISFSRDILPVLSNHCFACHGPDEHTREAGMYLHEPEGLYGDLESGNVPVVPGDRDASALIARITSDDANFRMPPEDFGKPLTDADIALLSRWVDEGAPWEGHWSFIPPTRPELPDVADAEWPQNDIDRFVLARLEKEGLQPSGEADRHALIRRVTFDLTGLPPTPDEVHAFVNDTDPGAYERVVDRLLASPRYGEHKARIWLDAARYADTNGYHIDNERYMWPWRDWVIRAYNENMPFDEFTIAQLAGDLLPEPSRDDLIATGFNRNHMINFEGGAIPEEYHTQYIVDRVNTTGTVWMGLTVNCAQCHDHKYDPISQREFYQLYSYFYNIPESGLDGREGNSKPLIPVPSPEQETQLNAVRATLALADEAMAVPMPEVDAAQAAWEAEWSEKLRARWNVLTDAAATSDEGVTFEALDDQSLLVGGENPAKPVYEIVAPLPTSTVTAIRLEALQDESLPNSGPGRASNANFVLTEFEAEILRPGAEGEPLKVSFESAKANHSQDNFDVRQAIDGKADTGWAILANNKAGPRTAFFVAREPVHVEAGSQIRIRMKHESKSAQHGIGRFRIAVTNDESMSPSRLTPWYVSGPYRAEDGKTAYETAYEPESGVDLQATYDDGRQKWVEATPRYADGKVHRLAGDVAATYLYRVVRAPSDRTMELAIGSNDAVKVWVNGAVVHDNNTERTITPDQDRITVNLHEGENTLLMKVVNYGNDYAFSFRKVDEEAGAVPMGIEVLLTSADRGAKENVRLRNYYRTRYSNVWRKVLAKRDELLAREKDITAQVPTTMVMKEMDDPREAHLLLRGQYDQKGDVVRPDTPEALPPMPEGADANRLGLAEWLVDPEHPLTARVVVNRQWQQHFGTGLVKTAEDFGAQGERPTHPKLLDWLAVEFIESGWDVKHMHRLIVTSAAYRQSSRSTPELNERDPHNRLLARGPRFRLDAEMIRDSALFVSGLLVERQGGPSVRPYQPPGIWKEVAYGANFTAQVFEPDTGDALHRRSMYTFWKRQAPPPNMMLFDAPNRETCVVRRERTNTPLQALTLMNDPQFVEASHALAHRMFEEGGETAPERIAYAFEWATSRAPSEREREVLMNVFEKQRAEFLESPDDAKTLLSACDAAHDGAAELAAYSMIANLILNLDETVTKS